MILNLHKIPFELLCNLSVSIHESWVLPIFRGYSVVDIIGLGPG